MTAWFAPDEVAKLDGIAVPPITVGFADRVMAELPTAIPLLSAKAAPRPRMRRWRRAGLALLGVAGAGVVSVAAATTLFGVPIRNVPVVGAIVETVSPAKPGTAKVALAEPESQPAPVSMPKFETELVKPAPELITRRDLQISAMAERIADRLDAHDAKRREADLPPRPPKLSPEMLERLGRLAPEDRRALFEQVGAIRKARGTALQPSASVAAPQAKRPPPKWMSEEERAALEALPPQDRRAFVEKLRTEKGLPALPPRLKTEGTGGERLRAYLESLTPEQRQLAIQEMKRRRAEKKAQASEGSQGPDRSVEEPVAQPLP